MGRFGFDTIWSSYDLGPEFNIELQTKDLGGLYSYFWIDPKGRLFEIDHSGTQDWIKVPVPKRFEQFNWAQTVPNGRRGKVFPYMVNGTIEIYPSKRVSNYAFPPEKLIDFKDGVIIGETLLNCPLEVESNKSNSLWKERYNSLKKWVKKHYET